MNKDLAGEERNNKGYFVLLFPPIKKNKGDGTEDKIMTYF